MITDTTVFERYHLKPPEMRRHEVVFYGGASASTAVGKRTLVVTNEWMEKHLPWAVSIDGAKYERGALRAWLNKSVLGMWGFGLITVGDREVVGVRFSDQTEASAFRIWWC